MSTTTSTMGLIKPDVNDLVSQTITDLSANFALIDALYPVGTVYQSTRSTDPGTFIGGTWTALSGRVLVGAGTDFAAGTTGGEKTHKLTVAEMPAHAHGFASDSTIHTGCTPANPGTYIGSANSSVFATNDGSGFTVMGAPTTTVGSGTAHNNMPPYRSVYMWERTA